VETSSVSEKVNKSVKLLACEIMKLLSQWYTEEDSKW